MSKKITYPFAILCGAIATLLLVSHITEALSLTMPYFDDAYMYARYVDNILNGYGYAWNRTGELTYGCTDITFTYLLCLVKICCPFLSSEKLLLLVSIGTGILAIVTACIIGYRLINSFLKSALLIFTAIPLSIVAFPYFPYHIGTGMDTFLSFVTNALLILSFFSLHKKRNWKWALIAAFAAYFTYLTRPDNGFYMLLFPALYFLFLFREQKIIIAFYGSFLVMIALDVAIKFLFFGNPLPLPFYAKSLGYYDGYLGSSDWNVMSYIFMFLKFISPFLILLILTFTKAWWKEIAVYLVPVYCTILYFTGIEHIMGYSARYFIPSIPFIIAAASISLDRAMESGYFKSKRLVLSRLAVIIFLILIFIPAEKNIPSWYAKIFLENKKNYVYSNSFSVESNFPVEYDWWVGTLGVNRIMNRLSSGSTIAASEIGYLGAKNPDINIIDLVALHDPYLALNGFSMNYVLGTKPTLIWLAHYNHTKINYEIVMNKTFQRDYDFIPYLFCYGIAIRRSDKQTFEIVQELVKNLYGIEDLSPFIAKFNS